MAHRAVGYCLCCADLHSNLSMCCSILHLHHQNHSKTPFCSASKTFFYLFSYMIVVSITYGTCIFIYIKPSAKQSVAINKGVTVLTSIASMLNPFIYTLKNKTSKTSLQRFFQKTYTGVQEVKSAYVSNKISNQA